ncbi:MAG: hypothetical protein JWP46_1681 [Modestobacter sp.]|nr:hypothetical protein [Modestobacter sp.]
MRHARLGGGRDCPQKGPSGAASQDMRLELTLPLPECPISVPALRRASAPLLARPGR